MASLMLKGLTVVTLLAVGEGTSSSPVIPRKGRVLPPGAPDTWPQQVLWTVHLALSHP